MIFGHFGFALLVKAKFYKRSLILILICSYLPDLLFYILFGIQWTLVMSYSPVFNGLLRWILSISETSFSLTDDPSAPSHSIILYIIFISIILIYLVIRKKIVSGVIYGGVILSHILFDLILPDANRGKPIVYPFYPFYSAHLELYILDATLFWLIDLSIFIVGFFLMLWAFSKKEGLFES
ncbi:MAG: hypothetical protein ACFFD2_02715 [Promethearchaeota archaeon]